MKIFELMDRKRTVKVFVGGNGHIAFEKSKKEIDAELVLEKLTSDDSKQSLEVQILKFLRNKHTNEKNFLKKIKNKNEELYKIFKEVLQKKDKRLHKKIYEHEDRSKLFQQQIIDSIRKKVENMIEKQTKYRRSESRWVDPKNEVSVSFSSNQADIDQTSWYIWSSNGKWKGNDTLLKVVLPYRWYNKVYIKGFAFVEGNLILDIVEKINENSYKVIAGKQGIGFEVYPAEAVITQKDGKWKIKWIKKKV